MQEDMVGGTRLRNIERLKVFEPTKRNDALNGQGCDGPPAACWLLRRRYRARSILDSMPQFLIVSGRRVEGVLETMRVRSL